MMFSLPSSMRALDRSLRILTIDNMHACGWAGADARFYNTTTPSDKVDEPMKWEGA